MIEDATIAAPGRLTTSMKKTCSATSRVLMIAHYFPPGTSSGTLRTVKFAKYLPDSNWEPFILTMRTEAYHPSRIDPSLLAEIDNGLKVYRTPVWMPDRLLVSLKKSIFAAGTEAPQLGRAPATADPVSPGVQSGLARHIRDWLQFPDAYGGWLVPGFWQAQKLMRDQKIDLIYSTAPSPVAHMIALLLRRWGRRPWVADFRDPWECLFPESVYVEGEHRWRRQAEIAWAKRVVQGADLVIANTERLCRAFRDRFQNSPPGKFVTIPNGFDAEDFRGLRPGPDPAGKFTICHAGTFFGQLRSPDEVLVAIHELVEEGQIDPADLRVILVGCGVCETYKAPYLEVIPRVGYKKSLQIMADSHVLLLLQQSPKYWLQVPAKTYEYLAIRRWILAITPEGATRDVVTALPNAIVIQPGQGQDLKCSILRLYRMHRSGRLYPCPVSDDAVRQFSREEQTRTLSNHFSRLVGSGK
jgi:glycosyltransferase involved in cell wall biosynthesis